MPWTEEKTELLKKLWEEGLPASQIAERIGSVSRNAVIGKVHRLKLSARGRATSAESKPNKAEDIASAADETTEVVSVKEPEVVTATDVADIPPIRHALKPAKDVVVPISRRLVLDDLTARTCKWPNGDPLTEDFNFCGNDIKGIGSYCSYHSRLAYQPAYERRRTR